MASGLISLAYLGEIAVVFNIAYIELKKTRYTEAIERHLRSVEKAIEPNDSGLVVTESISSLKKQINNMLDKSPAKRKLAWVVHSGNGIAANVRHHDYYAGVVFNFFDREWDKKICEISLFIATLLIFTMTVLQHWAVDFLPVFGFQVSLWDVHFWVLLVANLMPVAFVYLGRRMKGVAVKCSDSVEQIFTQIGKEAISSRVG